VQNSAALHSDSRPGCERDSTPVSGDSITPRKFGSGSTGPFATAGAPM
jgi:hypothetical protein